MLSYPADFGVTEEHAMLRTAARSFLAERCSRAAVRKLVESGAGWDRDLFGELDRLGWLALLVPEAEGGAGLGQLHLALLLEEMGRALLPSPFFACTLATLATGRPARADSVMSLALVEPHGSWEPGDVHARCERDGEAWVLRGEKHHVMHARDASVIVAPFRDDARVHLFAIELPTDGVSLEDEVVVDATRPSARVRFDGARVPASARTDCDALAVLRETHLRGAAALAAEMVGGAEMLLVLTRDYANDREQFGRKIGSFQAVKHPIVDTMIGVEQARTLVYAAAAAFDAGSPDAPALARMAKAMATDVYGAASRRAVQLHGGFGFTWECDVHFFLKRALWSRATLGDATHHRRHLGETLLRDQ